MNRATGNTGKQALISINLFIEALCYPKVSLLESMKYNIKIIILLP